AAAERRATLLAAPQAAEVAATTQLQAATKRLDALTELQRRLAELDQQAQQAATAATAATRLAQELTDPQLAGAASHLKALAGRADELAAQCHDLEAKHAEA